MKVYRLPDKTTVSAQDQFQIVDQKYPAGWIASASDAEIAAAGITVQEVADPPPPPPTAPVVSPRQFRQLFTSEETLAITTAAQSNVQLRMFLDDEAAAEQVHLDDPEVMAGLNALVSANLLTQDRANAILAGQPPA